MRVVGLLETSSALLQLLWHTVVAALAVSGLSQLTRTSPLVASIEPRRHALVRRNLPLCYLRLQRAPRMWIADIGIASHVWSSSMARVRVMTRSSIGEFAPAGRRHHKGDYGSRARYRVPGQPRCTSVRWRAAIVRSRVTDCDLTVFASRQSLAMGTGIHTKRSTRRRMVLDPDSVECLLDRAPM